jgi:hypothetical protein
LLLIYRMELIIEEKKSTYTPAAKKAIYKYRSKNIEKYNERQKEYYHISKADEDWKVKFNERCKENNRVYREKKRLENPPKPKGRPKKPYPKVFINALI